MASQKECLNEFPEEKQHDLRAIKQPIPPAIKDLLIAINSTTIEWLLKPIKEHYRIARRYRPSPHASVLKRKIPVEPHFEKPQDRVGYAELDSVFHAGGDVRGEHCLTIGIPELSLGWDEYRAARNKAMVWRCRWRRVAILPWCGHMWVIVVMGSSPKSCV